MNRRHFVRSSVAAAVACALPWSRLHRRSTHNLLAFVSWKLDGDASPHIRHLKDYWSGLERFTDGWYTNEAFDEGQQVPDANYQGNLPRLREIKRKYDPMNLFRLNANVLPA